ncbi:hypothetical protein ACHAXR_009663, partial [Thalassiosira sp. AJA248-18]
DEGSQDSIDGNDYNYYDDDDDVDFVFNCETGHVVGDHALVDQDSQHSDATVDNVSHLEISAGEAYDSHGESAKFDECDSIDPNADLWGSDGEEEYAQQYHEQALDDRMRAVAASLQNCPLVNPDIQLNGDADLYDDFLLTSNFNPEEVDGNDGNPDPDSVPMTNAGDQYVHVMNRDENTANSVPCHVLFNQAGSLCTRWNKRIKGGTSQQNFVQKLVSTTTGLSMPLLYLKASCFPRHFWAQSTHDPSAVLGCAPISCYSNSSNPHGFASTLSMARNLLTHSSSSTSTCHNFAAFCYDIQANKVSSGIDSRIISRNGFVVDVKSKNGITARGKDETTLKESVDSHQAALDLAATQPFVSFDWFLTFTCNQSEHPGICHLHKYKESLEWTQKIPQYDKLAKWEQAEVKRSYEMAYGSVLGRSWLEVRKFWLEYLCFSTSSILAKKSRVAHAFFRDEFQEKSGNLSHIHGLLALTKEDLDFDEFREHLESLQACGVCDLFPKSKIDSYIDQGLFQSADEWQTFTPQLQELGRTVLTHRCNDRCLRRIAEGDDPESFVCRKHHSVRGRKDPTKHELLPLPYKFTPTCLDILEECGLWEPGPDDHPNGTFRVDLLEPKRHMGAVHPGATCNMSPVIDHLFAATKSMQNAQILTGTNGVSRYVVKYIVKLDEGNRCTVWADQHTGAVIRAESNFLHNTKITSSKLNEDKAHAKSRKWQHPTGRVIAFTEMQQQMLGHPEVMSTLRFERICTKPFELRNTTKVQLTKAGNLDRANIADSHQSISPCQKAREDKTPLRLLTPSQQLIYRGNASYDKVTRFGMRPVELLRLFPKIGQYFRWFDVASSPTDSSVIHDALVEDVTRCKWFDAVGCRVQLRRKAAQKVKTHLLGLANSSLDHYSSNLREYLLSQVENLSDDGFTGHCWTSSSDVEDLPIPVFSSVTPKKPVDFLLHVMLMVGEFETELDLRMQGSMRESLSKAGLIGTQTDTESLMKYCNDLVRLVVTEVLAVQPVTLRRLDDYIIKARELVAIYKTLDGMSTLPDRESVAPCTKEKPLLWSPIESFLKSPEQSQESFEEQLVAIDTAVSSIKKYSQPFGAAALTFTKGTVIHGAPGCGKSHVMMYIALYALSQGLKVMMTALMGVRANALGGIHLHRLFGLMPKQSGNPYRLAELALDKLHRKAMLNYLHFVLTMDVLIIDECGQLSAQQLSILDLILRKARNSNISFGGVLVFGTMDHAQIGAIHGWPFLLSSHILTDFKLVRLTKSVRAAQDPTYQRIQDLTRMSPRLLQSDPVYETEFKNLIEHNFQFVPTWDSVPPDVTRMYPKRMPAAEASHEYVESCQKNFERDGTPFSFSVAKDLERVVDTNGEFVTATSPVIKSAINRAMKEPRKLLFWKGAVYHATINGEGYNQSQILVMLDVPTNEDIELKKPLKLFASPGGLTCFSVHAGVPTEEQLKQDEWTEVSIGHVPQRPITHRGVVGCGKQHYQQTTGEHHFWEVCSRVLPKMLAMGEKACSCGIEQVHESA